MEKHQKPMERHCLHQISANRKYCWNKESMYYCTRSTLRKTHQWYSNILQNTDLLSIWFLHRKFSTHSAANTSQILMKYVLRARDLIPIFTFFHLLNIVHTVFLNYIRSDDGLILKLKPATCYGILLLATDVIEHIQFISILSNV